MYLLEINWIVISDFARCQTNLQLTSSPNRRMWSVTLKYKTIYDILFLWATSTWLHKLCKQLHQFLRSGSNKCTAHLDYVKHILNFEWTEEQSHSLYSSCAVWKSCHLKFLRENGRDAQTVLLDCTKGTSDLAMIKYAIFVKFPNIEADLSSSDVNFALGSL